MHWGRGKMCWRSPAASLVIREGHQKGSLVASLPKEVICLWLEGILQGLWLLASLTHGIGTGWICISETLKNSEALTLSSRTCPPSSPATEEDRSYALEPLMVL